jgi:hypothetical protein
MVNMPVQHGQSFTGEVTYTSAGFVLKLTNNSTGNSFTTTQSSRKARRSSVEWIMEGPSSGLLSNYNSVSFSAASATISGQGGSLGSFAGADPITMVNNQGVVRSAPSLTSSTSFDVTWKHG